MNGPFLPNLVYFRSDLVHCSAWVLQWWGLLRPAEPESFLVISASFVAGRSRIARHSTRTSFSIGQVWFSVSMGSVIAEDWMKFVEHLLHITNLWCWSIHTGCIDAILNSNDIKMPLIILNNGILVKCEKLFIYLICPIVYTSPFMSNQGANHIALISI